MSCAKLRHRARRQAQGKSLTVSDRAELLCAFAETCPWLGDDFVVIADALGWTNGAFWHHNPAIALAARRWKEVEGRVAFTGSVDQFEEWLALTEPGRQ